MPTNPSLEGHPKVREWLTIEPDGRVRLYSGKVDFGQRISDALLRIAAEELVLDPAKIIVADRMTGLVPDEGVTAGSNSLEQSGTTLRLAAATLYRHLMEKSAEALEVAAEDIICEDGAVRARTSNETTSYGVLAEIVDPDLEIDTEITGKAAKTYSIVGADLPSRDIADVVTGRTCFLHDMATPETWHARVLRPPRYDAKLERLDEATVSRLAERGLGIVRDGSFVALVGADEWTVLRGLATLKGAATWSDEGLLDTTPLNQQLRHNPRRSFPVVEMIPQEAPVPPCAAPPADAVVTLSASYDRPYTMHGAIAPSAAMASMEGGKLTVWSHTQGIYPLRGTIAELLEMAEENLTIIYAPSSGCYGHNGADDVAIDAALAARAMPGRTIMLKWTREDEHAWEPYGPAMAMDLQASLDGAGRIVAWSHETYSDSHVTRQRPGMGPSGMSARRTLVGRHLATPRPPVENSPSMTVNGGIHRNATPLYDIESPRVVKHLVSGLPLRTSSLRALGAYANIFALESFMDELADAAKADRLDFRLRHLSETRARDVLQAAADGFDWFADLRQGRGKGISVAQYKNVKAYAAVAVEASVGDDAVVRLHRAVIACDAGQVVDPDGLRAQLEGGFLQSASWTLYEAVAYDAEGVTSRDWESYPILRFDNVPAIETILLERPGMPYLGAGETTAVPTAAAIAGAVYDAVGLRIRSLPLTPDTLRRAASTD